MSWRGGLLSFKLKMIFHITKKIDVNGVYDLSAWKLSKRTTKLLL